MKVPLDLTRFSFHDSSLIGASQHGSTIVLTVEYFNDDDVEVSVLATISGIESILRNDVPIQDFKMETPDGEIYRLAQEGKEVILIVFWHKYSPHSHTMRTYKMRGAEIQLRAEPS